MMRLIVPASMDAVIQNFDRSTDPLTIPDVQQALTQERAALEKVGDAENLGAWREILAFSLTEGAGPSPWGTYFCPLGSISNDAGETVYFPDVSLADATVLAHWTARATTTHNPVLRARYADLV